MAIELINHVTGVKVADFGRTFAWNWQQGARAMWLGSERVIFNVYDGEKDCYRARVVSKEGKHLVDLPIPVQDIDQRGRVYSLSYEALAEIRPDYGYRNHRASLKTVERAVIERYDLDASQRETLVELSQLKAEAERRHGQAISRPKCNHIMASPDSVRFMFLFRYFLRWRKVTDVYLYENDTKTLRLLVPDCAASHGCWWDDDNILLTMNGVHGFGYYIVPSSSGSEIEFLWRQRDGHPRRLAKDYLLTDTYPDRRGLRDLLIYRTGTRQASKVIAASEPILFHGETRCDLHPSVSPSGQWIQFDCAVRNRRQVAVIENPLYPKEYV